MSRRRTLLLCGAGMCAVGAVLVALLARDVGRWPSAVREGDLAASGSAHSERATWSVDEALPDTPARSLLGVGDDVVFRQAAVLFRRSYPSDPAVAASPDGAMLRIRAETALARAIRTDTTGPRASAASNMLGILALIDAATSRTGTVAVDRSVLAFQDAIRLDPSNEQAKQNLELLFRQNSFTTSVRGRERLQRSAHAGASASASGHGY
jgi:hypothetical protein